MPIDERDVTVFVADTPSGVSLGMAVNRADFGTGEDVHHVDIFEVSHILNGTAEVELRQRVNVVIEDTALGKYGDRQRVGVVGVGIEVRVACAYGSIFGVDTGAICVSLVAIVFYVVVLGRRVVAECADGVEFESANRAPVDFALELEVDDVEIDIVVIELVEDVKRRIVTSQRSIRVGSTRRVEGVAIRVDIEAALNLAADDVDVLTQRAGRFLLTVAVAGKNLDAQGLRQVVRCIGVERVALHLALLRPSRVLHNRQRCIEFTFIGTAADADGVVLLQCVGEEQVEPVGVAELSLAKVCVLCRFGVGETELAGC